MKELTVEEKAQRYDEAKVRMSRAFNSNRCTIGFMNEIFPELKESEDENIRKWLIAQLELKSDVNNSRELELMILKSIDWLEKQGESTDINPSEFDLRLNKLLIQFETLSKEELASSLSFYLNVVQNDGTYKAEEKQGEQKPTDEVESKFKVGDWVVDNCDNVWKIEEILNQFYILKDIEGGESRPTIEWTDNTFHLWTIQDAKDGDVLQLGVVTAIFQKYIGNGNCKCYCSVCDGIFEIPSQDDDDYYGCHDATPATKEQRELLFKSMKDDGYEWDSEKKELKKINTFCQENCKGFQETGKCFADGECKAKKEAEQKSTWSEDDENMIRYIGNAITCEESSKYLREKGVDMIKAHRWLESIRPQPKQEWSEEDSYMLESIVSDFAAGHKSSIGQDKWLKSLKPQNHWKPTGAQLASLTIACDRNDRVGFDLTQLLQELKKL